jgi:hypothetical protein
MRNSILRPILVLCWALVGPAILEPGMASGQEPQSLGGPSLAAILRDAADGTLDEHDLLTAALVIDGDTANLDRHRESVARLAALVSRRRDSLIEGNDSGSLRAAACAALLLAAMHDEHLHGAYQPDAWRLTEAIDGKAFNCATATVLYLAAARRCGLSAAAVERPEHVFVRVHAGSHDWDLETTRRGGIAPANPRVSDRALSDPQLLAILAYNRGALALDQGKYSEAVAGNLLAVRLDPSRGSARHNLSVAALRWMLP